MALKGLMRMSLWWSLRTLYLHARQVRVTVGDSGLFCCACVKSFERELTPLCVDLFDWFREETLLVSKSPSPLSSPPGIPVTTTAATPEGDANRTVKQHEPSGQEWNRKCTRSSSSFGLKSCLIKTNPLKVEKTRP